jgi:hypothetical protein
LNNPKPVEVSGCGTNVENINVENITVENINGKIWKIFKVKFGNG